MAELRNLIVAGATSLSGTLNVNGSTNLSGNTTIGGTLGVTGTATFSSYLTSPGGIHITKNTDVELSTYDSDPLTIGSKTSTNIGIDDNEIMARNNGAASSLYLNANGGNVYFGGSSYYINGGNYNGTAANATNADKVDGFHATQDRVGANQIPVANTHGYMNFGYINLSNGNDNSYANSYGISNIFAEVNSDGYVRKVSQSLLSVGNATNATTATRISNGFIQTLDLSNLNQALFYPCTISLSAGMYTHINVDVSLNSGTKPNWSTHNSGFTVHVDLETIGSGWGTSPVNTNIYRYDYSWCNGMPVSWTQLTNSSTGVLWCRGGGRYHVGINGGNLSSFTVRDSTYTIYDQSVSPSSSLPGIQGSMNLTTSTIWIS